MDSTRRIKSIRCPVHGMVKIPVVCRRFMDTPEFQRLGRVKQTGLSMYVYPSATHTRREHSIGVMHLAGVVVNQLRELTEIDERTKELVQLAGLLHDWGHLAYSHMFDSFVESINTDAQTDLFKIKDHETRSVFLLGNVNNRLGLLSDTELTFVTNAILGVIPPNEKRKYLYEIVHNVQCGIDVDKMDYLHRDAHHAGMPHFQSEFIIECMLINEDGHIVFKKKAKPDIRSMFETRHKMFEQVYFHKTVQKVERIYKCAFKRLGDKLFQYGFETDDMNIETLLRNDPTTRELMMQIDNRQFNHRCELCASYSGPKKIKASGRLGQVLLV